MKMPNLVYLSISGFGSDSSLRDRGAYAPTMQIDAQTYEVRADGQLLTCEPAAVLPMAQRYFLF